MHEHNSNDEKSEHKGMMWMMLVCCLLPVVVLLGGTTFFKSIGYGWLGIVLMVGFAIFHFRHMFSSHSNHKSDSNVVDDMQNTDQIKDDKNKSTHKGGCCH